MRAKGDVEGVKEEFEGKFFTLYLENLPDYALASWLEQSFSKYGMVRDIFIPRKRDIRGKVFFLCETEK